MFWQFLLPKPCSGSQKLRTRVLNDAYKISLKSFFYVFLALYSPLLFLLYINDTASERHDFFADDTCVYVTVEHPDTAAKQMETIIKWVKNGSSLLIPLKNESVLIIRELNQPAIFMEDQQSTEIRAHKRVPHLSSDCIWHKQTEITECMKQNA